MPSSVHESQVTVEGRFDAGAGSEMLVLALPIEIWTMLPVGDAPYRFVGFVESSNQLLSRLL